MPSIKTLEGNKTSSPESLHDAVESGGSDGYGGVKEIPQSQTTINSTSSNNGTVKEQPANPLQQIVLIIEHKIRNLEKRKNKLESYKAIEKSGKKLTSDQKTAVSKYEECLTSLELSRELCKQFQSIAAVANKEAKKEAKRSVFVRAQQENAKIREVLIIQDVLKRLSEETVRNDFRSGENGACKISDEDFLVLDKIFEVIQPKRPETTSDATFVSAIKQAADHLSAIADGRNKAFADSTYVRIKDIIAEVQNSGYFEKDLIVVQEELLDQDADKEISAGTTDTANEVQTEENKSSADVEVVKPIKPVDSENLLTSNTNDVGNPSVFSEAPAAAAVPTPAFPNQSILTRQSYETPNLVLSGQPSIPPTLITPSMPIPTPTVIESNTGIVATPSVPPAAIIVPTGPLGVSPIQAIPGQQLGATTVQAVEHAYFKQHYIQQQMRPIHEVIGTANFFFLQESEIDKPDIIPTPVQFGNTIQNPSELASSGISAQQPQQQQPQAHPNQAKNTMPAQSTAFSNQAFIAASTNNFNHVHQLQTQPMEQRQPIQTTPVKNTSTPTASELNHIPGFVSCNTTVISSQSPLPNAQTPQPQSPQIHNNQKVQLQKSTGGVLTAPYNPSVQQFPTLIKGLHETTDIGGSNLTQKLSTLMVDTTAEKLKTPLDVSEKLSMNHTEQQRQHNNEWNGASDYGTPLTKSNDQWPNNASSIGNTNHESSMEQGAFVLSRQSQHQQSNSTSNSSITANSASTNTGASNRLQQNGNSSVNYGSSNVSQEMPAHSQPKQSVASIQQMHQSGHRNARSASNSQYPQNSNSSSRFSNENSLNNSAPTFFKNNERFYQQNQNNFPVNKAESSYHQRNTMFKSRSDSNNSGPIRNSAYVSMSGHNSSGIPSGNNGNVSANIDYRSNARPVNSTRNTGPPSARPLQRNHSGNGNFGGPRGGSNPRGQSTINA